MYVWYIHRLEKKATQLTSPGLPHTHRWGVDRMMLPTRTTAYQTWTLWTKTQHLGWFTQITQNAKKALWCEYAFLPLCVSSTMLSVSHCHVNLSNIVYGWWLRNSLNLTLMPLYDQRKQTRHQWDGGQILYNYVYKATIFSKENIYAFEMVLAYIDQIKMKS